MEELHSNILRDDFNHLNLYEFDNTFGQYVAGIDEAGRGCLAGDVFAATVVLNPQTAELQLNGLNDSKKLTAAKREKLYDIIIDNAIAYSIAAASVAEIEDINILNASLLAMRRSYEQAIANVAVNTVLIDGNVLPELPNMNTDGTRTEAKCVIGGDGKSACIAAASILAKVARDRYMSDMDKLYPQYQFAKHKGYGTKLHREMLIEHGVSPIHRISFLKKIIDVKKYEVI